MKDRFSQFWSDYRKDALWAAGVTLVVFTAFGLGRATAPIPEKSPIVVEKFPLQASVAETSMGETQGNSATPFGTAPNKIGKFVASKNGTKYYLPSCSGANRIKEENRIWFVSEQEAESSGYEPAKNCPGL